MQDKTTMLCGTKKTLPAEADRLNALHELEILEGNSDEDLNRITRLVALHFNAPFAYISLIDSTVQQLKSTFGFMKEETPREKSFCTHTVDAADVFVVQDACRSLLGSTLDSNDGAGRIVRGRDPTRSD